MGRRSLLALLALACQGPARPAPQGSRTAELALEVAAIGRDAAELGVRAHELEGRFDALRAAPAANQARLRAEIHEEALTLQQDTLALQSRVIHVEAASRAW